MDRVINLFCYPRTICRSTIYMCCYIVCICFSFGFVVMSLHDTLTVCMCCYVICVLFRLVCFDVGRVRMILGRLHVLLRYMRLFRLACFVSGERHMILCHLDLSLRCMRLFRLASCMLGGRHMIPWPFACVVTLYAFVSLGLFCVGRAPYDTVPSLICRYVVCICSRLAC